MHNRAAAVARVVLTCLVLLCGAAAPAAARPQPPAQGAETPSEDEVPAAPSASAAPEPESSGRKPIALAQEFRLSTALWPGPVASGVDRFWGEIEYRPRVTGTRSQVSGAAELLLRASMSGFALPPDDSRPGGGGRGLRIQSDRQSAVVKELSVSVHAPVDLVIGWQILSWGHATDGVRVLDVFQRQDLTDRLRPEPLGIPAVSASFGNRGWETEAVWVPSALTDRIAASPSNVWYAFPRSSTVAEVGDTGAPGFALSHGEGGIRVSRYGQHGDFALMAARTRDRAPSALELRRDASSGVVQARSLFEPYWLVGASVVRTAGSYLLRAEAMHARYSDGGSALVKSGIRGVAGVERRISTSTDSHYTFIAQYAVDTTGSEQVVQDGAFLSSPFRVYGHALTASATAAWRRQYQLETRLMRGLDHGSTVTSAKLGYTHNDHLTVWVAADQVGGRAGTWLERLDAADRILVGVTVNR